MRCYKKSGCYSSKTNLGNCQFLLEDAGISIRMAFTTEGMQKCIYLHSRTKTFYQESCLHTTSFFAGFSSLYIAWTQSGTAEHAAQIKKEQNSADSWRSAGGGGGFWNSAMEAWYRGEVWSVLYTADITNSNFILIAFHKHWVFTKIAIHLHCYIGCFTEI